MDLDILLAARENPAELAQTLTPEDIVYLVGMLPEKDNDLRYAAFLVLKKRSESHSDVFTWWDVFAEKLSHENSYQRSIGTMLLAENVRWDKEGRLERILDKYLARFRDEKFITARQAIQSLLKWLPQRPDLYPTVLDHLVAVPVDEMPPTQRKLILLDILEVLLVMRPITPGEAADAYLFRALDSALLDKKTKEAIRRRMGM